MVPKTMRAVVLYEHGDVDKLIYEDAYPVPAFGPLDLLVQVKAVGLNHLDVFVRRGMPGKPVHFPRITGGDIAGVVATVGTRVTGVQVGQRVLIDPAINDRRGALGEDDQGGLAEFARAPGANAIPLPDDVSFEDAAALPIAYGTAWRMLITRGRLRAGEHVLIGGAAGGVGTACVQIAKMAGCTVYAMSSTAEKLERLRALGADYLINYAEVEFDEEVWRLTGKRGVDVVVDYTGRGTWVRSLRSLRPGGRLLTCGATAGYDPREDLRYVWVRELDILGANGWERADLEILLDMVRTGRIRPVIDRVIPLTEVREAQRAMEQREIVGKVIVTP